MQTEQPTEREAQLAEALQRVTADLAAMLAWVLLAQADPGDEPDGT